MSRRHSAVMFISLLLGLLLGFAAYNTDEPEEEPTPAGFREVEFRQEEAGTVNERHWVMIDGAGFRLNDVLLPEKDPSKQTSREKAELRYIGDCATYVETHPEVFDENDIVVKPVVIIDGENAQDRCLMEGDTAEEGQIVLKALAAGSSRVQFTPKEIPFEAPEQWERKRFDVLLVLSTLLVGVSLTTAVEAYLQRSTVSGSDSRRETQ